MSYQIARPALLWLGVLLVLGGCAATPDDRRPLAIPVYPPPPDTARFIYERTLLYSSDIEDFTKLQRFKLFATGASRQLKGLVKPFDVAVHQGRVYVSDSVQRCVLLFDLPGKRLVEIGLDDKKGELTKPLGLTVSVTRQELFVVDTTARRIVVYDLDGHFQRYLGGKEQLQRPSDVALSPDGNEVYVVDTGGIDSTRHNIQVFDAASGQLLRTLGRRGSGPGEFNLPLQIAVSADGLLHIVDSGNFRVQVIDDHGTPLASFGTVGRMPGQFARPKGIAIDAQGNSYIVDTAFGNVQIFNPQGQLLMFLGERGEAGYPGKFMLPSGIAVDENGSIYVVDQFFRKVDVFRPLAAAISQ
ncbi:MAG: SMP-30/gluconolactonase/LRE family protein [Gammaproteobacteria bacterium]|nr:SMP-30/gluconolactonase/LRE family protein [Gammaproteobacteria bacterium]